MIVEKNNLVNEPRIFINGAQLSTAQCMSLRVAASWFYLLMGEQDVLGEDEAGKAMAAGYRMALREVVNMMEKR